jgi:hypothetical protein
MSEPVEHIAIDLIMGTCDIDFQYSRPWACGSQNVRRPDAWPESPIERRSSMKERVGQP